MDTISKRPASEHIAVVWYCVLATADRLTQPDIAMIRELDAEGLKVILVLTKVEWTKNPLTGSYAVSGDVETFRSWLENPTTGNGERINIPLQRVVLTSTRAQNGRGAGHGLGDLVAHTLTLSPDDEKDAFRVAQRLNVPWKREMARPAIALASSAAAAAAAVPIPVADAVALVPIQMTMMGRIAAIYDLELKSMLSASTLAQIGAQVAGKALARSFIKLIPGAGNVVNASVAFALTAATGEAWMRLCENVHTGKIKSSQIADAWSAYSPTLVSVMRKLMEQRVTRS